MTALPAGPFSVIYADPPWSYKNKASRACADNHYPTMSVADLCALPVAGIAAADAVLVMWHVPTMPLEALRVVEAWGFTFKTMKGFTWAKRTKHDKEHIGLGNYTRANTEDALIAVRGRGLERLDRGVRQLVMASMGRHSKKPDEVRERIVRLWGDVPRIELFARAAAPGWACWGNEAPPPPPEESDSLPAE